MAHTLTKETQERLEKMRDQEERLMLEKFYLQKDEKAREGLILKNVKIVEKVIKGNFDFSDAEYDDAYMDGVIALERAIDEYDINQTIFFHFSLTRKVLIALKNQYPNNIKTAAAEEIEEEENIVFEGDLSDHFGWNEEMIDKIAIRECMAIVREYLDTLPEETRNICEYHWGINDGDAKTLQETANHFGLSRERVRVIVGNQMPKLAARIRKGMNLSSLLGEEEIENA